MIAFDHGALRGRSEPALAGIVVHAVLPRAAARALSFLTHVDRFAAADWSQLLEESTDLAREAWHYLAVARLRDAIADAPASEIMLELNDRIERISQGRVHLRALITSAAYGMLMRHAIGHRASAELYRPFETFIPLALLG